MLALCSKSPQYVARSLHKRDTKIMTSEVIAARGKGNTSDAPIDDVGTQLHSENWSTKNIIPPIYCPPSDRALAV